jgi:hypothetical protein
MALATTTDTATLLRLAHAVIAADPVRNTVSEASHSVPNRTTRPRGRPTRTASH